MLRKLFLPTLLSALVGMPLIALAKSDSEKVSKGDEVVAQALQAESTGDLLLRSKLLSQADQLGNFASAKWHQGLMQNKKGAWVPISQSFETENEKLSAYEAARSNSTKTVESQMSLARWCVQQGLIAQARSHLNQVLQLDYNNAVARNALGYRYINDQWVSPSEFQRIESSMEVTKKSYEKYGKSVQNIARGLEASNNRVSEVANQKLMAIKDSAAIPAVEAVFHSNQNLSKQAITWLASIDSVESSQALAKYALLNDDKSIRDLATEKLKGRPLHDVVPKLLEMMAAPATATMTFKYDKEGNLVVSQHMVREGFGETKIESVNTRFMTDGPRSQGQRFIDSQMKAALDFDDATEATLPQSISAELMRDENNKISDRNRKIGTLVAALGNVSYNGEPRELWKWWDGYNETNYQSFKMDRYTSSSSDVTLADPPTGGDDDEGECFVEGTPVVTQRGMKAIETVQIGDQVLSRSTSTGELTWKPVLRATRRPLDKTRVITLGKETIQCTTGHLLWVSGQGWKKVSEIKCGDVLHGAERPLVVDKIEDAKDEVTHNLDVADFGTYFVGNSMIMSHDVKPRSANRETVPGLKMVSTSAATKAKK